eukprot:scaffold1323_cov106-Skeletonema_marinoi.AAC.2
MEDNNGTEVWDRTDDPYFVDKAWLDTIVVVGLTCFVLCLMKLSKVATSKMGMIFGMIGMTALVAGYWADEAYTYDDGRWLIAVSMAPGILLGLTSALSVEITSLPELVGAYNGFGGFAAALEAIALYVDPNAKNFLRGGHFIDEKTQAMLWVQAIALVLSIVIGMMTFTGSMIACLKLHGTIASKPRVIPYRSIITLLLFAAMVLFGTLSFTAGQDWNDRVLGLTFIIIVAFLASVYGVIAVMAIGGGDMPVSISFLNALSGMSTSAAGFMLSNEALVVSGAFICCSGIILTLVMCKNMNRSILKVLVGGFGDGSGSSSVNAKSEKVVGTVKEATAWDVFELLTNARKVIIVPGYGMAVAKAQHACAELACKLRAKDINVLFAIHPVAGRMPGHMNVLLAEAKVPYDITFALDDINADFADTDVALVLGANDIVNPGAQTDADSPIAGMPVLEVWKATHTICMKRSLNVGYAGVDNPLFVNDNNMMFLGDAKTSLLKLISLLDEPSAHFSTPASSLFMGSGESMRDIEAPKPKRKTHQRVKSVDPFLARISELQSNAFLKVGVVREIADEFEARVAMTPDIAKRLLKSGIQVVLETNAGIGGGFLDGAYAEVGCKILNSAQEVYDSAGIVIKIREPIMHPVGLKHEIEMMTAGSTLIAPVSPQTENGRILMDRAKEAGVNLLAVDAIPRISRAQNLDTLSSQSKIAGYRAVIEAAYIYQRFMNGEVTSAGSFGACKVLVIGAGVAGLAAIATASNMGAIVRAFDTRLECREQVESLGGEFLVPKFDEEDEEGDMEGTGYSRVMSGEYYLKEMELFSEQAKECQIIITTAAIPGRPAPKLIMKDAVDNMAPGSVIVDLAASTGGNCQLTKPGSTWTYDQRVTIVAYDNLSSRMSWQASSMYANNMANLLDLLCKEHEFVLDMEDPVVRGMTVVLDNTITWPPPKSVTQTKATPTQSSNQKKESKKKDLIIVQKAKAPSMFSKRLFDLATVGEFCAIFCFIGFFVIVGFFAPISFVNQLLYFILAGFLGFYLIWAVEPALFSPLMSTSNSLSGVVILGGILMASEPSGSPTNVLACSAIAVSTMMCSFDGGLGYWDDEETCPATVGKELEFLYHSYIYNYVIFIAR